MCSTLFQTIQILKIGLTGGMGCGKTTATKIFADHGWRTVVSDAIVHDLLDNDESVRLAIRERWGDSVFDDNKKIDRKMLAARVFSSTKELGELERVLHPIVRQKWQNEISSDPDANWLVEIPLLFEKKLEPHFDLTVCVESTINVIRDRLVACGYTEEAIKQRSDRQMPLEEKIKRADCVLSNSGTIEFLEKQIELLIDQIRKK